MDSIHAVLHTQVYLVQIKCLFYPQIYNNLWGLSKRLPEIHQSVWPLSLIKEHSWDLPFQDEDKSSLYAKRHQWKDYVVSQAPTRIFSVTKQQNLPSELNYSFNLSLCVPVEQWVYWMNSEWTVSVLLDLTIFTVCVGKFSIGKDFNSLVSSLRLAAMEDMLVKQGFHFLLLTTLLILIIIMPAILLDLYTSDKSQFS